MASFVKKAQTTMVLGGVAVFASACALNTPTYGTGKSVEAGLVDDIAGLVTFGALGPEKPKPIRYRERAGLVIPNEQQLASIPAPQDKIDTVSENFPGEEEEREKERRRIKKQTDGEFQPVGIGHAAAKPLDNLSNRKEDIDGELADEVNRQIGPGAPLTPQRLDESGGVREKESILQRAGLVKRGVRGPRNQRLTDVPNAYRTVQTTEADKQANDLVNGQKKKKKKRFLFF